MIEYPNSKMMDCSQTLKDVKQQIDNLRCVIGAFQLLRAQCKHNEETRDVFMLYMRKMVQLEDSIANLIEVIVDIKVGGLA